MISTQLSHCVLCLGLSLWLHIVSGAGSTRQHSGLDWLKNSISESRARTFCADILNLCDKPFNNGTSIQTSPLSCRIAECCRSRSLLQTYSKRLPKTKIRLLKNMCFAKWAYIEMLENNKKLKSEALQKIGTLVLLERNSSKLNTEQKSQLALDLQKIASSFIGSETSNARAGNEIYPTIDEAPLLEESISRRSVQLVYQSTGAPNCQMRMTTVLVRYSLTCVPKSILIWYCHGTCVSRSVPEFHDMTGNVRSVEDCACCSARSMRYRTVTFRCTGGDVHRRVTWPFDCACRPCSTVPTMEELQSP